MAPSTPQVIIPKIAKTKYIYAYLAQLPKSSMPPANNFKNKRNLKFLVNAGISARYRKSNFKSYSKTQLEDTRQDIQELIARREEHVKDKRAEREMVSMQIENSEKCLRHYKSVMKEIDEELVDKK